jgi:hypothetical protein
MQVLSSSFFVPKQALRKAALVGASALAMVLVAGQAKADNLVLNGSFEQTTPVPNTNSNTIGQMNFNIQATDWTVNPSPFAVTNNNVNSYIFLTTVAGVTTGTPGYYSTPLELWTVANGGNSVIVSSPDGGNFIAADGAFPTPQTATINQTINGLTPGKTYALSFDWAAAQQHNYFGATSEYWTVSLGGQTESTTMYSLPNHDFSGWMGDTMYFTATSSSEVLSFLAQGAPGESEPPFVLLDGVSLSSVTPEPGTLTLLLTGGMAGFGALSRRRWMIKGRKAAK